MDAEGAVNMTVVVTLFERFCWQWTTVDGKKSCPICWAHLPAAGPPHLNDIYNSFTKEDPLGLRSRIQFFFTQPQFKRRSAKASARDAQHNGFCGILEEHHPDFKASSAFAEFKEYPFRIHARCGRRRFALGPHL
jgi:hypothetical protein